MMKNVAFLDGVNQVHLINGVIRIDTYVLEGKQDANPEPAEGVQLAMTPQGFLSLLGAMQHLAGKLEESGLLQRNPQQ